MASEIKNRQLYERFNKELDMMLECKKMEYPYVALTFNNIHLYTDALLKLRNYNINVTNFHVELYRERLFTKILKSNSK